MEVVFVGGYNQGILDIAEPLPFCFYRPVPFLSTLEEKTPYTNTFLREKYKLKKLVDLENTRYIYILDELSNADFLRLVVTEECVGGPLDGEAEPNDEYHYEELYTGNIFFRHKSLSLVQALENLARRFVEK